MENKNVDVIKYCYLSGCNEPVYPDTYYCTRTHQLADQEKRYGRTSTIKAPLSILQIQDRIKQMGVEARKKKITGGIESSQG